MRLITKIVRELERNGWKIIKRDNGPWDFIFSMDGVEIGIGVNAGSLRRKRVDLLLTVNRKILFGYLEKEGKLAIDTQTWVSAFWFIHNFLFLVREIRNVRNISLTPLLITPVSFRIGGNSESPSFFASARFYLNKSTSFSVNLALKDGVAKLSLVCDGNEQPVATPADLISQIGKLVALMQV